MHTPFGESRKTLRGLPDKGYVYAYPFGENHGALHDTELDERASEQLVMHRQRSMYMHTPFPV
jgi:hypothetical protein